MAYNDHKREYDERYKKEHLKRIPLEVSKEKYAQIQKAAASTGESVNGYIKTAIDLRMSNDSTLQKAPKTPED